MEYNLAENPNTMLPPGTVHLVAEQSNKIILVPKPSADPNDPLNWSKNRKRLNVTLLLFYVFTTGIGGTSVYSVFTPISKETAISIAQLNNGTGYLFLMAGWTNIIWQPLALTFGRRPIILLSLLFCVAISEWTAWIDHYPSWAAARCLYGLACAPVEVLPQICIPDVFFAHERGAFIGWYMFVLCASNFIAPLIAGFMNDTYGWHWVQHWAALILALNFVLAFFLYEESMYTRTSVEGEKVDEFPDLDDRHAAQRSDVATGSRKETLLESMKLWSYNGNSFSQIIRIAYRPILIFFQFPNIMWAGFMYGFALAWYNVYNATTSAILSAAPYDFSAALVGLSYVAPLIGATIAGVVSGPVADWLTLRLASRLGGLREPEQRLWGLVVYCLLMPGGLLLWGLGTYHQVHWAVILLGGLFCGYCNVSGGAYALAYAVDCFKELSGETIVSVILCRNTLSFAFNYAITPWIDAQGLQKTFIAVAILSLAFGMSFLLMEWKGKALRVMSAGRYWKYVETQVVKFT
ncbi:hypothetical protein TMatcc_004895 [Talaromyces marneffei ATCC 18224]|uniref:Major facilitator superfamily (MFS) profile domain-containing protein n=1 Tax=Talaromyces marneffei (strain ATCC 18224 / CBS 334.59 / QM 7333) TaxID=441960 RepID=B6Q1F3_TALMQ|nr:uncharacterized protein EYB26_000184 [Talaromyces marneffei]EEA26816.1 conserved hypothetical protein [Talaromyces marneffei ATCC 18224]KAE8557443.1 hypothetical protein EYB25_002150 [Talaromyces marneffei]QGA12540.1 hypothetical protein EYB26_000184 [Talaromyces marneffei]